LVSPRSLIPTLTLPQRQKLPPIRSGLAFDSAVNARVLDIGNWAELSARRSPFMNAGLMCHGRVWTCLAKAPEGTECERPTFDDHHSQTLDDVVKLTTTVPESYLIPASQQEQWERHKKPKSLPRAKGYSYSEGGMSCPDRRDRASRTIITGEGGATPSRFKHLVAVEKDDALRQVEVSEDGHIDYGEFMERRSAAFVGPESGQVWRRLVPEELEELNGFPAGWTRLELNGRGPIPDTRRAFMMGNALVVGIVRVIGKEILRDWRG